MNLDTILKQYQKSFVEVYKFLTGDGTERQQFSTRILFDFFDQHKIYIDSFCQTPQTPTFSCDLVYEQDDKWEWNCIDTEYPTRIQAEDKAFDRAFQILEKRL